METGMELVMLSYIVAMAAALSLSIQGIKHGQAGMLVWPLRNWIENLAVVALSLLGFVLEVNVLTRVLAGGPFGAVMFVCNSAALLFVLCPFLFFSFLNIWYHLNCIMRNVKPVPRAKTLLRMESLIAENPLLALDKLRGMEGLYAEDQRLHRLMADAYERAGQKPEAIQELLWLFQNAGDVKEAVSIWGRVRSLDYFHAERLRPHFMVRFPQGPPLPGEDVSGTWTGVPESETPAPLPEGSPLKQEELKMLPPDPPDKAETSPLKDNSSGLSDFEPQLPPEPELASSLQALLEKFTPSQNSPTSGISRTPPEQIRH